MKKFMVKKTVRDAVSHLIKKGIQNYDLTKFEFILLQLHLLEDVFLCCRQSGQDEQTATQFCKEKAMEMMNAIMKPQFWTDKKYAAWTVWSDVMTMLWNLCSIDSSYDIENFEFFSKSLNISSTK